MKILFNYSVPFWTSNVIATITIISEIGIDMSQFCSSKCLCYWAKLIPSSNESAGKKKSVRITRARDYLKSTLVQCTYTAVKSDKSPYYKKKYKSLVKRRGKKEPLSLLLVWFLLAFTRYYLPVRHRIQATFTK